jgi:AcrR family transcriptional regulator
MSLREKVVDAALALILARGWRGVTTEAVAKRARISKKTLYQLFPSKEALLEAALRELLRTFFARLDAVLGSPEPPLVRVDRFLDEAAGVISQAQQQILEQARGVSPRLWRRVEAERRKRLEAVGELVREAQTQGLVRPDLDVDLWLVLLRTAVEEMVNPERVLREGLSAPRILDTLRKVLFEGILTDEGHKALARYREGRRKA